MATPPNIQEIILQAKKGEQKAFSELLNTFWSDVYHFQLLRTRNENDAEDICVRTFSKAFEKIETYDPSFEFKTWLITISKNIHIDLVRKQKSAKWLKTSDHEDDELLEQADDAPTAEDLLITQQNLDKLLKCIKVLKPHYQEVINLRYFQELTYEEIAKELGEPLTNIKVKLLRAKRLLAEILQSNEASFR